MRQITISEAVALLAASLVLTTTASAQTFGGPTVKAACDALDLRACTIQFLTLDDLGHGDVGLELVMAGSARTFDFWQHSNRGAQYQVLVQVEDGSLVQVEPSPVNTYRGAEVLNPLSRASLSIEHDGFRLRIQDDDGGQWFAEPLAGRVDGALPGDYAVYMGDDIISPQSTCPVNELWRMTDAPPPAARNGVARGGDLFIAEMCVDADYEFYQIYNSVSSVENRVNAVINAVNDQYENQVSISHELQTIVVRSTNSDPYSTNNIETRLDQLQAEWNGGNHPGIARDMVHLFTGASTGSTIGLAYLGAVCSSYEYGVVQSNCCGSFGCATDLSAHEMGHNWGSDHCTCPNNTMHPSLTCSNNFTSASQDSINAYRSSIEDCLDLGGPNGACCLGTTCVTGALSECESLGGVFQGDGTNCSDIVCDLGTGACCFTSGSCVVVSESQCNNAGADYQGDNVPCDTEICEPEPIGACCTSADCAITEQGDCTGSWLGPDTTCDDDPCSGTAFAGIEYSVVGVNLVDDPADTWTVDVFAIVGPGERLDAVAGTSSQQKTVASSQGFWQSSYGGPTSADVNPAFYPIVPDLRYDSRVTIGSLDSSGDPWPSNALGDVGIDFSNFENGGAISADDGTWYVLPTDAQGGALGMTQSNCDPGQGVLIARLTAYGLDSDITVAALFQGRNALGVTWQQTTSATISLGDWADCNENGSADACDIAGGSSQDANGNGIPDECEGGCAWDLDGDGDTDVDDLLAIISGFGPIYDVDDLLELLSDFGCG